VAAVGDFTIEVCHTKMCAKQAKQKTLEGKITENKFWFLFMAARENTRLFGHVTLENLLGDDTVAPVN